MHRDSMANVPSQRSGPGSGPLCPGCGKPVDPLRAGHVAIVGGRFLYFCDARCKTGHMRAADAPTAEPPPVAPRTIKSDPPPRSQRPTEPVLSFSQPPPATEAPPEESFPEPRNGYRNGATHGA